MSPGPPWAALPLSPDGSSRGLVDPECSVSMPAASASRMADGASSSHDHPSGRWRGHRRARHHRSTDDDSDVFGEIRHRLAEHGEQVDDYSEDDLRAALRVTLVALAHEFAPDRGGMPPTEPHS
jgi:hypothetical protein